MKTTKQRKVAGGEGRPPSEQSPAKKGRARPEDIWERRPGKTAEPPRFPNEGPFQPFTGSGGFTYNQGGSVHMARQPSCLGLWLQEPQPLVSPRNLKFTPLDSTAW